MKRIECPDCLRPAALCYCPLITPVDNRWPVLILQEQREAAHALGTARIAALGLADCRLETISLGPEAPCPPLLDELPRLSPVLIYPGRDAAPLASLPTDAPRPLLFIDASWRKSRRLLHEHPSLARLPRYSLEGMPSSRYRIRRTALPDALSTLEAITHALELLEGSPGRYAGLLAVMDWMIDQQIARMGEAVYRRNY